MEGITGLITGIAGFSIGLGIAWFLVRNVLQKDLDGLQEKLRAEIEKRSAAEEKSLRIPEIEESLKEKEAQANELQTENATLKTRLEEEQKQAAEKLEILVQAREQLKVEFQNVANKIFEDTSQKSKVNLDGVLNPMREQLKEFKQKIEDVYDKESKERISLLNEIVHLKTLNERISEDAVNLTSALKGQSKTRGDWGEMILERVLEESGLHKGREYESQTKYDSEEGRRRHPDVVVHLPEGKDIVIDSKVSLVAYEKYCSADNDEKREKCLKEHNQAIRTHVKDLSEKKYEELEGISTLDFVLMFLPIESALLSALEADTSLFNEAFEKNIMLVSPSTLLLTLRIIQNMWRYEDQNRNAQIIAKKAGDFYKKLVGFVEALDDVGDKVGKAQKAYETAHNRLVSGKGNLVKRAEELRSLGVKADKALPESLLIESEEE